MSEVILFTLVGLPLLEWPPGRPSKFSAGLAVRGETARQAERQVHGWLRRINLL